MAAAQSIVEFKTALSRQIGTSISLFPLLSFCRASITSRSTHSLDSEWVEHNEQFLSALNGLRDGCRKFLSGFQTLGCIPAKDALFA